MLPQNLGPIEVRVLGALMEKDLSTPDQYPLSLNALVNACNQSSNRDPVLSLDEATVSAAVDTVRRAGLVRSFQGSGSRVPKYQHLLSDGDDTLTRAELAVLCVLALRGAQTSAEVRMRASRLVPDDDVDVVDAALEALMTREPAPAVVRLERQPGQKEQRYMHLLGGEVVEEPAELAASAPDAVPDRVAVMEVLLNEIRDEVTELRAQLAEFRRQFE